MYVKKAMFLSSLIIIISLLLTGCISPKPVNDPIILKNWEYAVVRLANDASISKIDGVEIIYNGQTINPENVESGRWFIVKKTDPNAGMFVVRSESGKYTNIRLAKKGDCVCPYWASNLYGDSCITDEILVHK